MELAPPRESAPDFVGCRTRIGTAELAWTIPAPPMALTVLVEVPRKRMNVVWKVLVTVT
jgi:hypothetical protein